MAHNQDCASVAPIIDRPIIIIMATGISWDSKCLHEDREAPKLYFALSTQLAALPFISSLSLQKWGGESGE